MRIKFLSIIASFFMVSFVITSCLDNDNEVNYSPDATIRAFELDTIGYGVKYKFTIDQISRLIYNVDSLPVNADTIIKYSDQDADYGIRYRDDERSERSGFNR